MKTESSGRENGNRKQKKYFFTINKRNIEALPSTSKGERRYVDVNLEGFEVRVGKRVKAFYIEKRENSKPKRVTLGRFSVMSCEQAKAASLEVLGKLSIGIDPNKEKRQAELLDRRINRNKRDKQASLSPLIKQ